jgi:hypothetical protein
MNPACQSFRHQIYLHVDGELAPTQHPEFVAHRDACPPCAQLLKIETDCNELLKKNLRGGEMPEGASRRLERAIRWERGRRTARTWGIGIAALLLAGFAVRQASQLLDNRSTTALAASMPVANPAAPETGAQPLKKLVANTTLNGRLVCVSCLLSERHGTPSNCVADGHRGALLLASGEIIYFTDPSDKRLNKPDSDILDRMVTIEGDYMPREKYIQVKNFQLAES